MTQQKEEEGNSELEKFKADSICDKYNLDLVTQTNPNRHRPSNNEAKHERVFNFTDCRKTFNNQSEWKTQNLVTRPEKFLY